MEFMIGEEAVAAGVGAGAVAAESKKPRRKSSAGTSGPKSVPFSLRITAEAVSIIAMALTTLALGTALHMHAGFAPWSAIATSVAAYICMLGLHAYIPRHYTLEAESGPAREGRRSQPQPGLARSPDAEGEVQIGPFGGAQPVPRRVDCPTVGAIRSERVGAAIAPGAPKGPLPTHWPGDELAEDQHLSRSGPVLPPRQPQPGRPSAPPPSSAAQRGTPQHTQIGQTPGGDRAPQAAGPARDMRRPPAQPVPPPVKRDVELRAPSRGPREEDVEMIQGLIKKLADEVNAASAERPQTPQAAAAVADRAANQSVDALNKTASSMRDGHMPPQSIASQRKPQPKPAGDVSETGRPVAVNAKLSSLAEALTMGRVEVLLDPIVDFHAHRPRHFEVFIRLRDASGKVIDSTNNARELASTGMLPRLDATKVSHASAVAMRFEGRTSALFSDVTGEALRANSFLDGVAQAYEQRNSFAGQLIMTFAQADVRRFGLAEWGALRDFRSLGFRYCIAGVSDLDMDFEDLRNKGFEFVKLDADVFL
ncbi:MAG: EAL domain-containing protein, partial [Hyphomicrobiaceae bacterium]|nr:EAL domain-containing protein [Hyphomicrobiaceae bacterium]